MVIHTLYQSNFNRVIPWLLIIVSQSFMAVVTVLFPYYSIPLFFFTILLIAIFFYPELAYYLFVLFVCNELLQLKIVDVLTGPAKMQIVADLTGRDFSLARVFAYILIFFGLISFSFSRMAKIGLSYPRTKLDTPMAVFFMWTVISLYWTPDWMPGIMNIFLIICCYSAFYLSVSIIRKRETLNSVIWLLIVVGLINSAAVVYSLYGQPISAEIWRYENMRLTFNFLSENKERGTGLSYTQMTAYLLNVTIILSITLFILSKDVKRKIILSLMILFMTFAEIATISKAGLLGLVFGLTFIIITYKPLKRNIFFSFLFMAMTLITLAVLVYLVWPWPEKGYMFIGRGESSSFFRMLIWENGFEDVLKNYGLGYGVGSAFPAHSIYFQVLFDLGIPGLCIFLWMLFRLLTAIKISMRKYKNLYYCVMVRGVSAGIISMLIFGLFDGIYFEETIWLLFGILMAIIHMADRFSLEESSAAITS